jgi:hypothetical protein
MKKEILAFVCTLISLVFVPAYGTAAGSSFKIWIGNTLEIEEFLRTAPIVSTKPIGEGRNNPRKLTLEKGDRTLSGIWKPIERGRHEWAWECYQAEVVAYEMDKLLGLNMVPPTVERSIGGQEGSLQLWIEGGRLYEEVIDQSPETKNWKQNLSRMQTFDNLICNPDRHPGNIIVDSDWNMILIDHSQCFISRKTLHEDPEKIPSQFDRKLVKRLKELSLDGLQVRFSKFLLDSQIESLLTRRDALLAHIDKLIAEKGEKAVLF